MVRKLYRDALELASVLHKDHYRKGSSIPYLSHLLGVSALILKSGGSEDQAIAGLLHDAIEDQGDKVSLEDLARKFGPNIAELVKACTDETEATRKSTPWYQRKKLYLDKLPTNPLDSRLVILCDKLDNMRDMSKEHLVFGEPFWERFTEKKVGSLWFLREMDQVFTQWQHEPPLNQLPLVPFLVQEFHDHLTQIG